MKELFVLFVFLSAGTMVLFTPIESDRQIQPEIRIETINGVSDTTYIYKRY
jgi:hypothetical protein